MNIRSPAVILPSQTNTQQNLLPLPYLLIHYHCHCWLLYVKSHCNLPTWSIDWSVHSNCGSHRTNVTKLTGLQRGHQGPRNVAPPMNDTVAQHSALMSLCMPRALPRWKHAVTQDVCISLCVFRIWHCQSSKWPSYVMQSEESATDNNAQCTACESAQVPGCDLPRILPAQLFPCR